MIGPNVKKLIFQKMSTDAIPPGGGVQSAVEFLSSKEGVLASAKSSTTWVAQAIAVVRTAFEPNPWKNATDEEIAGEILRQLELRRNKLWG